MSMVVCTQYFLVNTTNAGRGGWDVLYIDIGLWLSTNLLTDVTDLQCRIKEGFNKMNLPAPFDIIEEEEDTAIEQFEVFPIGGSVKLWYGESHQ